MTLHSGLRWGGGGHRILVEGIHGANQTYSNIQGCTNSWSKHLGITAPVEGPRDGRCHSGAAIAKHNHQVAS